MLRYLIFNIFIAGVGVIYASAFIAFRLYSDFRKLHPKKIRKEDEYESTEKSV